MVVSANIVQGCATSCSSDILRRLSPYDHWLKRSEATHTYFQLISRRGYEDFPGSLNGRSNSIQGGWVYLILNLLQGTSYI